VLARLLTRASPWQSVPPGPGLRIVSERSPQRLHQLTDDGVVGGAVQLTAPIETLRLRMMVSGVAAGGATHQVNLDTTR
jgi:hypothetical protein